MRTAGVKLVIIKSDYLNRFPLEKGPQEGALSNPSGLVVRT